MASGDKKCSNHVSTGTVTCANPIGDIHVECGFKPMSVKVFNVTHPASLEWSAFMAADSGVKTVTAGTVSFIASDGITSLFNGFVIGDDAVVQQAGDVLHWVAIK